MHEDVNDIGGGGSIVIQRAIKSENSSELVVFMEDGLKSMGAQTCLRASRNSKWS